MVTLNMQVYIKFCEVSNVIFDICERTDMQTNRRARHNISHPSNSVYTMQPVVKAVVKPVG